MGIYRSEQSQSDRPARLSHDVARQMAREALRTRRSIPLGGNPAPYGQAIYTPYAVGLIPAIVTTAISACSGTTPGSGYVTQYYWDVDDSTTVANPDDGANCEVLNWYQNSGTIAVGTHVYVTWWSNALWFCGGDC